MRALDPTGQIVETDQVWWWQLPDVATQAEVRMICSRNALSEVASASKQPEVRLAIVDLLSHYAMAVSDDDAEPRHSGELQIQCLLDWSLVHPDPDVQEAADALWREVLEHHRRDWEMQTRRLVDRWNDPLSPLHNLRRRLQSDADDE